MAHIFVFELPICQLFGIYLNVNNQHFWSKENYFYESNMSDLFIFNLSLQEEINNELLSYPINRFTTEKLAKQVYAYYQFLKSESYDSFHTLTLFD